MLFFKDLFNDFNDFNFSRTCPTDISEDEACFTVVAELAGFKKENISINYENGNLILKAVNTKNSEVNYSRQERFYGEVKRSFYLGYEVNENEIKASLADGLLTIVVPKLKSETKSIVIE